MVEWEAGEDRVVNLHSFKNDVIIEFQKECPDLQVFSFDKSNSENEEFSELSFRVNYKTQFG